MDWESRYLAGDTPWDKGAASPPLVHWLTGRRLSGRVLVPGCGAGHDVRALASAGAEVIGLDIAPSAIEAASRFPRVGTESYCEGDLFALPPEWIGGFDMVFEHTCFCAIDPVLRPDYVRAVRCALRPGGALLAVFYLDPGNSSTEDGPPFGCSVAELETRFSPDFRWIDSAVPSVAYPGREGRELIVEMHRRD